MKLRNKKTGEIIEVLAKISFIKRNDNFIDSEVNTFDSLAKLNENWEDYEEPKECWYIDWNGEVQHFKNWHFSFDEDIEQCKQIGNYFETKEEAEKAVEKLKAWKLLKDYNVKYHLDFVHNRIDFTYSVNDTLIGVVDAEEKIFNAMKIVLEVKNESNL